MPVKNEFVNLGEEAGWRWISREPSGMVARLRARKPHVCAETRGRLCSATTVNFVKSLIAFVNQDTLAELSELHGIPLHPLLQQPIRLIRNVPLYLKDSGKYIKLRAHSGDTLIKCLAGDTVGIVLNGKTAGALLVPKKDTENLEHGMAINRLWNDEIATDDCFDYKPLWGNELRSYFQSGIDGEMAYINFLLMIEDALSLYYQQLVDRFKKDAQNKPIWTTDLFFHLCKEAGLPLDQNAFYFTRPFI